MEIKRSLTNLAVRKDLQLPRNQLKKGFLYVFNRGFRGSEYVFMNRLWVSAMFPATAADQRFGKRRNFGTAMKFNPINTLAAHVKVTKEVTSDVPHFTLQIPVYRSNTASADQLLSDVRSFFFDIQGADPLPGVDPANPPQFPDALPQEVLDALTGKDAYQEVDLTAPPAGLTDPTKKPLRSVFIPTHKFLIHAPWLTSDAKSELGASLLGVKVEVHGARMLVSLVFKLSKEEAQQLTSTAWVGIRNIDVHPIIHSWVLSYYGAKGRPLLSSFPISLVAKTLPADHAKPENVRVDANGLAISPEGTPLFLPREVNNTQRYEDLYSQAGAHDTDQGFAYTRLGVDTPVKLPHNIPVLVDWQNLKFAYTTTQGVLTTLDLARFVKCDAAHANELMSRYFTVKLLERAVAMSAASSTSSKVIDYFEDEDFAKYDAYAREHAEDQAKIPPVSRERLHITGSASLTDYYTAALKIYNQLHDQQFIKISEIVAGGFPLMMPVFRFLTRLHNDVASNLDAVYEKYSVAYTISIMGWVTLISKYGSAFGETQAAAAQLTKAAREQRNDPDWEMPSVPLLSDKVGVLPHQKKVRNLLKDSPDFAILPVPAGGGKTPIILIDLLMEIKANTNQPYLILCPGHLVPQYVKEIVYFTAGKLNVIPITSYAIRTSGYARIEAILKAAPRNTVVVANYDVLRFRAVNLMYGTTPIAVYPVIEFLRQFHFGYVACDESHYVKNKTGRTAATLNLIADIPKKRLASGTMAHDSPSDLAIQIAMLDPTLFGSRDDFNSTYGLRVSGNRVIEWVPGAAQQIMAKIKSRVVVAGATRKEWAALLPTPIEKILRVDMSDAQQAVYQSVLEKTLDEIKEAAKSNADLARFISGEVNPDAESEGEEEARTAALESMLRPYLARLEAYLTAPARDPLGNTLLSGEDRVSPKVRIMAERIRDHIAQGLEGKILIFTNYTAVAEEIFNNMPDDLKACGILYTAAEKIEAGAEFENNPKKKWMVGVENSMNTGLNLQFVSRLIREACVWNPGTLEQGNSRVNRPELKKTDRRDFIYYDWLVANNSIDVTKISRLVSKVVAIAKFENPESGEYQAIPDVPVIPMTLKSVFEYNSWDSNLKSYFDAYRQFKQVQQQDYEDYKQKHGDVLLSPVKVAETPEDAKLLKRVPYVPGLELYGADQLGLVRADEYARMDTSEDDEEEADTPEGEDSEETGSSEAERIKNLLKGKLVHTEHGDGEVVTVGVSSRRLAVKLSTGLMVRTRFANTFVVTRKETSTKDIRNQLLKSVGELPIATPVDVPAIHAKPATVTQKEMRERLREERRRAEEQRVEAPAVVLSAEFQFSVSNGFLGVTYMGEDETMQQALAALGFRPTPPFIYAEVKTPRQLVKQFNVWEAADFTLEKKLANSISQSFRRLHKLMDSGGVKSHKMTYNFSVASQLANFFRTEYKASNDPRVIKPYPMIEDGRAYIVLPLRGQAGTLQAIQHKAPGVRWVKSDPSMIYFCSTAKKATEVLQLVLKNGISISNLADLKADFNKIKRAQFRGDEDLSSMEV